MTTEELRARLWPFRVSRNNVVLQRGQQTMRTIVYMHWWSRRLQVIVSGAWYLWRGGFRIKAIIRGRRFVWER